MSENHEKSSPDPAITSSPNKDGEKDAAAREATGLPNLVPGSGSLDRLVDTARDYARQATAENTNLAYKKGWAHFNSWCRRRGANPLPPSAELIGLYTANCASPDDSSPSLSVSTIERRLSGMAWQYQQRGFVLDRKDRHIATVLAGIKRKHARPPAQKEAILPEDIRAMVATLPFDLRGLRDKAILLVGYAGGLRRSEIVSLDHGKDDTPNSGGWIEIVDDGAILFLRGKTGWREVEIGRGSSDQTCPVHALEQWLHFAKIDFGPLFRRTTRDNKRALNARLSDKHVARLIKQTVLDAGMGQIDVRITAFDRRIDAVFKSNGDCRRIARICGVGPKTATAVIAAVGDGREFKNGRHLAAWMGLVPRQHSSGDKRLLMGISKRGDRHTSVPC